MNSTCLRSIYCTLYFISQVFLFFCFRYVKFDQKSAICEPYCKDTCFNANCIKPNTCGCFPGFNPLEDSPNICAPYCEKDCIDGKCVAPNICQCYPGFDLTLVNGTNHCLPFCQPSCLNGECVSPNTCECMEGYQKGSLPHLCQPFCSDCQDGRCVAPEVCDCFEGFKKINGSCVPQCFPGMYKKTGKLGFHPILSTYRSD